MKFNMPESLISLMTISFIESQSLKTVFYAVFLMLPRSINDEKSLVREGLT